jgi:hypothetical protein
MKNLRKIMRNNERGVTAVIVGVMIVFLLGMVALAVDIGYALLTRNELQNVADAAALAGGSALGEVYQGRTAEHQGDQFEDADVQMIRNRVIDAAKRNQAGGKNIDIRNADITIGIWDQATSTVTVPDPLVLPNAVKVIGRRDTLLNDPIPTVFAAVFGVDIVGVSAKATAALSGASEILPTEGSEGEPPLKILPVGIPKYYFDLTPEETYCGDIIVFHPTNNPDSCAGWNSYTEEHPSDNKVRNIIKGLTDGTIPFPGVEVNKTQFGFIGGDLSKPTFEAMYNLWNQEKNQDGDGHDEYWTVGVVVYDDEGLQCKNPNKMRTIVGIATVKITNIELPPDGKVIEGQILCDYFIQPKIPGSEGGSGVVACGEYFGTYGSVPCLVD